MHYYSYRFISLLGTLLYVQVTRDSSQWELSYTHYQGSTTGHSTRVFHHQSVYLGVQRWEVPQPCQEVQAWPGQSLIPPGMWQSTGLLLCVWEPPQGPPLQQSMLSMVPSLPSRSQGAPGILESSSKLWLCLLWPQHHGTNTHNTAALNSAWLH